MTDTLQKFKKIVWNYYKNNKRDLPWRKDTSAYSIVISEVMLQQTQVNRILVKYPIFIKTFPDFESLSTASLKQLLQLWQGIGYNRRALYLQKIAQILITEFKNTLPKDPTILETFPGIGPATAASIIVYTYNLPFVFIETNIRKIFIHHFFQDKFEVHDKDIHPLVKASIDKNNPREWYWALMDYGTMLVRTIENPNRKSKHYSKQSKFEGSDRQIRGKILRLLLKDKEWTLNHLLKEINDSDTRIKKILDLMIKESIINETRAGYFIK